MTENELEKIIERYSDYDMPHPYWISLCSSDVELTDDKKEQISDFLNEYFAKNGPDAEDDFTSCESRHMTHETAEKAIKYAVEKAGLQEIPDFIIDGVGSVETDGRENDPVTGELLHAYPIHADSIIDEIQYLKEQDELSKDDWRWLHMAYDSYGCCSHIRTKEEQAKILKELTEVVKKHSKTETNQ